MQTFDPDAVSALTFDSYSTVVDVASVTDALAEHVDDLEEVSTLWRTHSLFYTLVCNHFDDSYDSFYELNRQALTHSLAAHDVALDEETRDEILAAYMDLDVFEDVRGGMERLADEYDLYIVSNGDPEMLDAMVQEAEVEDLVADTISADEIETYKPAAELYEHAADRVGVPVAELAHTSALWYDVQGAQHAGMQGVWANRGGDPWVRFDRDPDLEVSDFHALADELGC